MLNTSVLQASLLKKPLLSLPTSRKKAAVPNKRGFEQPRHPRPTFSKHRNRRRSLRRKPRRRKLAIRRWRFRSPLRRPQPWLANRWSRRKPYPLLYWRRPRPRRFSVLRVQRQRLYRCYTGGYIRRHVPTSTSTHYRTRVLRGGLLARRPSRFVRIRNFFVAHTQPTTWLQRSRWRVLRRVVRRAKYAPRKITQSVVSRRSRAGGAWTRKGARNRVRAVVRQRLYTSGRRPSEQHSRLRFSRLLSSEARGACRVNLVAMVARLRRASGKALRTRLHRRNKRGTTNFFFDRRVKAKRRYVPRRVWRQGRRGYAGLFGKRRYRVERRDKQLARRTSKRSVTQRTLLVRSILSQKTYRASNEHSIRYKAATAVQLLTSVGEKPAKLLAANAQQGGYDATRYLAAPRLRRSKQRACLPVWPMKGPVGRALLMRTNLTAFAFLQGGNYKLLRDVLANKKTFYALPRKHDYRRWTAPHVRRARRSQHAFSVLQPPSLRTSHSLSASLFNASRRSNLAMSNSSARRASNRALWALNKTFVEKQFYARRPQLRLPQTSATRSRRRKGGLGLFAQNSLRTPKTLTGLRSLLLPPVRSVSLAQRRNVSPIGARFSDFSRVIQRADDYPRYFVRRRLRWIDLAPAFWVTYSSGGRTRRRRLGDARKMYRVKTNTRSLLRRQRLSALTRRTTALRQSTELNVVAATAQRESYGRKTTSLPRSVRAFAVRKFANRSVQRLLTTTRALNNSVTRAANVWHARATRLMQQAERAMSAWSPQYQTRWRRWASPRQEGVLLRRAWPSARTVRDRRRLNAALSRRHLPQRRYWDRSFIHLQYHHGSAASSGYTRLRRSHRLHSRFSRWWKPNTYRVPFVHPLNRRLLNSKRYYRQTLDFTAKAQSNALPGYSTTVRTRPALRMERHMISRKIPWRNFNYPTPKRGAPAAVQRWTMRFKGYGRFSTAPLKPQSRTIIALRSPRELRQLEQEIAAPAVLPNHLWEQLDYKTRSTAETAHVTKLFNCIPASIWFALRKKSGSAARYAALQRALLANYRQWSNRVYGGLTQTLPAVSSTQSMSYLLSIAQAALSSEAALVGVIRDGLSLTQQKQLSLSTLSQRIKIKQHAYWKHRELPAIAGESLGADQNPLARENSHLYKRWLHGAERFLQKMQRGYAPTARSRYSPNFAVDFGRRRMRFPATGRRKRSFDSMLHAFAKRASPARFRRSDALRFARPLLQQASDFRSERLSTNASAALQRQRFLVNKLSKTATLAVSWREILSYRLAMSASQQNAPHGVKAEKRRFMPLPTKLLHAHRQRIAAIQQPRIFPIALRALRVGVLRRALRRRRNERAFIDLRKSVLQRRTPRERALRPGKLRRRARLRARSRTKPWRKRQNPAKIAWGLSHLGMKGTRLSYLASTARTVAPSGELLVLPQGPVRRDLRAVRGFSITFARRTRRLRRKVRDSRKGRRGHRRRFAPLSPRQAVLLKTHWSEGKELRGFRRFGKRHYRPFVKKFLNTAPKLFGAVYGGRRAGLGNNARRAASVRNKLIFNSASVGRMWTSTQQRSASPALSVTIFKKALSAHRKPCFVQSRRAVTARLPWRKTTALLRQQVAARKAQKEKQALLIRAAAYTGHALVEALPERNAVCSLYFQNPTSKVVKSEGAKAKELEADIASKEDRYKLTAQYVENLTRFIPELINHMISTRIMQQHKITFSSAQHLVRNIYWSLRIYLNVDPFDVRFTLRDRNPSVRVRMSKLMDELAALQRTEQPQRAALRFRFQPARLLRLRNKLRFRSDWLRNFLPAKHALYLENAEEYGLFLLRTQQIRRLRFGPRGIASWRTATQQITYETRARQLLSLRYSRATPRFETMLQSTRRAPDVEGTPFAVNTVAPTANFFARAFSTASRRNVLVGARLRQQTRFALPAGDAATTPFVSVASRYRVLPRVESRGRTSYVGTERPSMLSSFLDARALRIKSPRSRQYLLRTAETTSVEQLAVLGAYRSAKSRLAYYTEHSFVTRNTRRFSRPTSAPYTCTQPDLLTPRKSFQTRGTVDLLTAEQARRAQKSALAKQLCFTSRRVVHPRGWAALRLAAHYKLPACSRRSVLHNRTAQLRSVPRTFRAALVLPSDPITAFAWVARRRRRGAYRRLPRLRRRAWLISERTRRTLTKGALVMRRLLRSMSGMHQHVRTKQLALQQEHRRLKTRLSYLRGKFVAALTRDERREAAYLPKRIAKTLRKLATARKGYRAKYHAYRRVLERENRQLQKVHPRNLKPTTTTVLGGFARAASTPYFFVMRGGVHSTMHVATEFCVDVLQERRQASFDTHRARLWDKLTLRRMKKERIVRYWIKGTSRWMRDPWIANIVSLDLRSKPGRLAGELRPIEQQIGEYVPDVDARGKDIPYDRAAMVERHAYAPRPQPKLTESKLLSRVHGPARFFVRQRLEISKSLRRKPIPAMWLANYEYNDFWREFKEEKAKSLEQKREEAKVKRQEALERAAKGLPSERKRRYALKMPPFPQLPKIIWKEIHRRARRLEWRESDEVFFRKGFRNAFNFYPAERNRAPWLEALMYTRATFSTRLREFRRRQFPREQKRFKWLQRVRKALFATRTNRYIRGRRWSQLRIYNQRLHYSLFNLPDRNAARRHFRKLSRRTRPAVSSFVEATRGLGDRLDVTLLHLKVAPSIFWARVVAPFGLIRVDGVLQTSPAYRIKPGAVIQLEWERIARFQHFFQPSLGRREAYQRRTQRSTSSYPTNFEYHRGTRTLLYRHAPDEADLRRSSRLQPNLFRWFKLDSLQ